MVSFVTISGSSHDTISVGFDTKSNAILAEQIAKNISAGVAAGTIVTASDASGPPPPLPSSVSGVFVQTQSSLVVLPPGYSTDIVTKSGPAVVFGSGSPETILSGAATDLTFIATSGSGTVIAGGGANRLSVSGSGSWLLNTGGGNDIVAALGAVSATIAPGSGSNAILLGDGNDVVDSTGKDTITGGSGSATINATGAVSDLVEGHASNLLFLGGGGGVTILGGTGSDTYLGATGETHRQLIEGGSAGNNFLFAGSGSATLIGGGSGDQLFAYGAQHQLLVAGAGNETLSAAFSTGGDTLKAGSGKDLLIGGSGADTFVGGSGSATIQAGFSGNVFEFINHQAGGTDLIQGIFDPASIKIDLVGYGKGAIDNALHSQTVQGGSVTIGLTDGTKITFQDVTKLDRSNFV
ncbi:MAG TPA: calcium-binding protein [Rhodopila sp.]